MEKCSQLFSPKSNQMATKSNPIQIWPSKKIIVFDNHLEDRERDLFEPALSFPNLPQLIKSAHDESNNNWKHLNLWESNLARSIVPHNYHFLDLVNWCVINYEVDMQQIIYVHDSRILCEISKESIFQMIQIPNHAIYEILDDVELESKYKELL